MRGLGAAGRARAARLALAVLTCLGGLPSLAEASEDDARLEQLMTRLATSRGLQARFEERIESPLLAEPVTLHGWLAVVPPDRLVRVTETPERTRLVLSGDALHLEAAGGPPVDLAADPAARLLLLEFSRLFRGDLPALRARYELGFRARGSAFELSLTPKSARVRERLLRVVLAGQGDVLQRIEVHEAGGGRTTTRLLDVDPDRALTPDELARFFGPLRRPGAP